MDDTERKVIDQAYFEAVLMVAKLTEDVAKLTEDNEKLRRIIADLLDDGDETDRAAAFAALQEKV